MSKAGSEDDSDYKSAVTGSNVSKKSREKTLINTIIDADFTSQEPLVKDAVRYIMQYGNLDTKE